ncbi:DUF4349 domain-containing protein [Dysosmobacter sp.]|uniref:DUF4349 domain-containing protein n=1 Tax=Dysosmobacter sp. TaxID=2591382 RepID=UPI002A8DC59A|nr:DUF4349 domain-containing protein [Dysosmobacter sp.]MDY3280892.1 DUF4349 domain-containing protein [Dysosmobacter sp.]
MKKKHLSLAALVLAAALALSGCGSSSGATASNAVSNGMSMAEEKGWAMAATEVAEPAAAPMAGSGAEAPQGAKRIYTADLQMETTAFDSAVADLTALVERTGGYFESSSAGDYGRTYRSANYTVRIPAEQFQPFLNQVGQLCHVTWQTSSCEDVSEYYYDTAGRLETQRTKLERLQELLARAESMEDIITLESAISETEERIESLSGELQHYDALVDYSTVCISLQEVYRLSNTEEAAETFGDRVGSALSSGWRNFTDGLEELAVGLAYNWVAVLILLAVIGAVVTAARRRRKRKAAKKAIPPADDKSGEM